MQNLHPWWISKEVSKHSQLLVANPLLFPYLYRTCPMQWMQQRSQINWVFILCVTVTGTSRPPAPPAETACTKGSTGCPTSSKTLNDPFHPRLLSALCVYECVKGDSTGYSLTWVAQFIHLFFLSSLVYIWASAQCCLIHTHKCVCVCFEGGSSLAVPFKIDTQRTARFSLSLSSPSWAPWFSARKEWPRMFNISVT